MTAAADAAAAVSAQLAEHVPAELRPVGGFDGLQAGRADITPDSFSAPAYETWLHDPKPLERDFAAL